jgi:hypothetical protein
MVREGVLRLVLKALNSMPFAPMMKAPLNLITYNMYKFVCLFVFLLLAIAIARRVSELSHLAIRDFCRIQNSRITFLPTKLGKVNDSFLEENGHLIFF